MQQKNYNRSKSEILRLLWPVGYKLDVLYVSFNVRDSQVSSYSPFYFSFTVPSRELV